MCWWDGGKHLSRPPRMPPGTFLCRWKQEGSPPEPWQGDAGCFERGLLFAQMWRVPSHLALCRRGTHCTTHQQHLRGGPGQARESRTHQSTDRTSTNKPGSRLGADTACADVQLQLFSITKSSRIYQKTQESCPAEGPQHGAHASPELHGPGQTSTPPPPSSAHRYYTTPRSPPALAVAVTCSQQNESSLEKPHLAGHRGELRHDHT